MIERCTVDQERRKAVERALIELLAVLLLVDDNRDTKARLDACAAHAGELLFQLLAVLRGELGDLPVEERIIRWRQRQVRIVAGGGPALELGFGAVAADLADAAR